MGKQNRYPAELRERAPRLLFDGAEEHGSQWAVIRPVAEKIGCTADRVRRWVRQAEKDRGPVLTQICIDSENILQFL